jgi:histone acetyltransferase
MPREQWFGFIKDYDGGTLMECRINHQIDYLDLPRTLQQQREMVFEKIKTISSSHIVLPGLTQFKGQPAGKVKLNPDDIPGVRLLCDSPRVCLCEFSNSYHS